MRLYGFLLSASGKTLGEGITLEGLPQGLCPSHKRCGIASITMRHYTATRHAASLRPSRNGIA